MYPCDTWTIEKVTRGKMNSKVRGSFLSLEGNQKNYVGKVRRQERKREKKSEKEKEKEREKKRKNKTEGECVRVRGKRDSERRKKERKREQHFLTLFLANRPLKRVGARDKVGPRDESYAWVLETAGFVVFQKIGVSLTRVISCLEAMKWPFWFSSNLRDVFIYSQGPNPVFRD